MPTFNCVFEYQLIASEILTQPSYYKRAESNLLSDGEVPQHWIQVVVTVILYTSILNTFIVIVALNCMSTKKIAKKYTLVGVIKTTE